MSQKPPKQRPTQGPTIRRTPVQRNPVSTNHAPQPEAAPEQTPPHRSQYRQAQYRQAVPRRDPFPLLIGGIIGAALVGVVLIVLLLGGTNTPNAGTVPSGGNVAGGPTAPVVSNPTQQAGGSTIGVQSTNLPGTPVPEEGKKHVPAGEVITYANYPPSSGTHYDSTAEYGFSDKEIAEGQLVHSLEHGAIVLYYKPGLPADVLDSLRQAYTSLPLSKHGKVKMVIAPYPKLQTPMAIAAWTRVEPLTEFNFQQIQTFYQALVDKGPEDVP